MVVLIDKMNQLSFRWFFIGQDDLISQKVNLAHSELFAYPPDLFPIDLDNLIGQWVVHQTNKTIPVFMVVVGTIDWSFGQFVKSTYTIDQFINWGRFSFHFTQFFLNLSFLRVSLAFLRWPTNTIGVLLAEMNVSSQILRPTLMSGLRPVTSLILTLKTRISFLTTSLTF